MRKEEFEWCRKGEPSAAPFADSESSSDESDDEAASKE